RDPVDAVAQGLDEAEPARSGITPEHGQGRVTHRSDVEVEAVGAEDGSCGPSDAVNAANTVLLHLDHDEAGSQRQTRNRKYASKGNGHVKRGNRGALVCQVAPY